MTPDLSVLVASIHTRYRNFGLAIQDQLFSQWKALPNPDRVQVMVLTDTKSLSIGHKRNALARAATGRYIQFIDDDDRVAANMMASVLEATSTDVDVITFRASVRINGGPPKICRYSRTFGADYNTEEEYRRIPNHLCVVKRELALDTTWGDVDYGEDRDYSTRLLPRLKTEHEINQVLYFYDYSDRTSESKR